MKPARRDDAKAVEAMMVVGLTGNVAAGKTAVADLWRQEGVPVASADEFAREAVASGSASLDRIRELFGPGVIAPDGGLDRAALRKVVFRDPAARRRLEAVVHPVVRRLRDEWTAARAASGAAMVVWEVPLLFETGMEREVDAVVVVDAPAAVRRGRIVEARGLAAAEADAMIAAQLPADEKRRRADFVVENAAGRAELRSRASEVLAALRRRARRRASLREVVDALAGASSAILTTHVNADGDGVGSQVALASFLRRRGTKAWIVNPTPFPSRYAFLLPEPSWVLPVTGDEARERCAKASVAVILDASSFPRIGRVNALVRHLPKVVIDHHPLSAEKPIDGLVLRDTTAPATGSIIFRLIELAEEDEKRMSAKTESASEQQPAISRQVASALYLAILTDTGGFRFSNVTPDCLRTAARLVELGADPEALHSAAYGHFHLRRHRLLHQSLATLEVCAAGRIAHMTVPDEAFRQLGATPDDLEGFVEIPRTVDGAEVALLFRATADGKTKVSLRSNGAVDVNEIAARLGGGGHPRAAGAVIGGSREAAAAAVLALVKTALQTRDACPSDPVFDNLSDSQVDNDSQAASGSGPPKR